LYQDKKVGGKKIYAAREWIAVSSSPAFQHPLFTTPSCPAGNPSPLHGKGTGVRYSSILKKTHLYRFQGAKLFFTTCHQAEKSFLTANYFRLIMEYLKIIFG